MNNQQWLTSIIEEYEKPLCRYAYSLSGSVTSARDAVQETFLRLCRAERRKIEGHEAAWLFKVCRSRVFDMLRKEKPVQALTEEQEARIHAGGDTPAEAAIARENEELIPRLLRQLPERQQEAVRLKFQQKLSYREIAGIMKTSESNVGFMIHVGIKALRAQMQNLQGAVS